MDCMGLILNVAWDLGLQAQDKPEYLSYPRKAADGINKAFRGPPLEQECDRMMVRIPEPLPGSVGLFFLSERARTPQHFAFFGTHPERPEVLTIIHTHSRIGHTVEATYSAEWPSLLVSVYDLPQGV